MSEQISLPGKTILCVDDDRVSLRLLREILKPMGYKVLTAIDGKECLDLIELIRPDLILLDIRMPRVNGIEALEQLKKQGHETIPVILLTADSEPESIKKGYANGCASYITKPYNPQHIRNTVNYLIGEINNAEREKIELKL